MSPIRGPGSTFVVAPSVPRYAATVADSAEIIGLDSIYISLHSMTDSDGGKDSLSWFILAVAKFVYNLPTALEQYLQDHLQECKFVLFAVLAAITAIAATCALCVLVPAVLRSVVPIGKFVLSALKIALNSILYPIIWVLRGLEMCFANLSRTMHRGAGVAARGVRPIDVDARGQLGFFGQRTASAGVLSRLRARMGLC